MSTLAGMWERQRPNLDRRDLGRLLAELKQSARSEVRHTIRGRIATAIAIDAPFTEPVTSPQPLEGRGGLLLTWDGRLDNRADLISQLRTPHPRLSDAALVLALIEEQGDACIASLVGDFSFVLWNPASQGLLLARDAFGVRPLFYWASAGKIAWASDIRLLLTLPGIDTDIDDEFVAGYLTREPEAARTPYRAIRAVPAGHTVSAFPDRVQVSRYWTFDRDKTIDATDAELDEQFRALLRDAIRSRMRVDGPVCAELSGGLDSSAIVRIGDDVLARGEASATSLWTASYVYDQAPSADEREFIEEVERARGAAGLHISGPLLERLTFDEGADFPCQARCFSSLYEQLGRALQARGTRVLLCGVGGDHVTWGEVPTPLDLADLLKQRRISEFRRRLIAWSLDQRRPLGQLTWQAGIRPLLPLRWRHWKDPIYELPLWYGKAFAERMHLSERMRGPAEALAVGFRLPSQRVQCAGLTDLMRGLSCGYLSHYPGVSGTQVTYPYLHRPLVEFSLAVPMARQVNPGETRALMRRALRGVLPEKVRTRRRKKGPSEAMCNAVAREWPRLQTLLRDARICQHGYFEPAPLLGIMDATRHGRAQHTFLLGRALALEFWLRARETWRAGMHSTESSQEGGESHGEQGMDAQYVQRA
jgi:asparagine synthase (glutamine-hydrolysing)